MTSNKKIIKIINKSINIIVSIFVILFFLGFFVSTYFKSSNLNGNIMDKNQIHILSSYENKDLENHLLKVGKENKIKLSFTYMSDLDIVKELNNHKEMYDAVWISNSIWLYMLDNFYLTTDSKSISISPVVMGIRKSKADELGLIDKKITNEDILNLIKNKKIKYVMPSVTKTNTGATAYLGFLNTLANSPEVLTDEMLKDENLIERMVGVFSGVERVSGEEDYLETMFLNNNQYEAIISSEASLININKKLLLRNQEPLYLLYPIDGVAINDSTFAFIKNDENLEKKFLKIQEYLLSEEGQMELQKLGRRTWYGGISNKTDKKIFNPDWGINTQEYLITTKYPSKKVMTNAINIYIERLRKPTHVVFCLDYSGSMYNQGITELRNAMEYILDYERASKDQLQFSKYDKITVITFGSDIYDIWESTGKETNKLIRKINIKKPVGTTALYKAINKGIDILERENDDYTKTIIAMTDGAINVGSFNDLRYKYINSKNKVPVYSIMFGEALENELLEIANLTNSKVFDGRSELLKAFKEVRGYN